MCEGSEVSKITIYVKILKWQSLTHSVTKGRYRAARIAKNTYSAFNLLNLKQTECLLRISILPIFVVVLVSVTTFSQHYIVTTCLVGLLLSKDACHYPEQLHANIFVVFFFLSKHCIIICLKRMLASYLSRLVS